jgi:hypothetical protein
MIINITSEIETKKAEVARRTLNAYVSKTYPHYKGEIEELKNALIEAGCTVEEYITPTKKMTAYDVNFNGVYSGGIGLYDGEWILVVTNEALAKLA